MTTKNILKALGLAVILTALAAPQLYADTVQDSQLRMLNTDYVAQRVESDDTAFIKLTYVGSSTEAVVTIVSGASASMTFYAPAGTADTDVDTDGTIDLTAAAYDTVGEFCDYIDGLTDYECDRIDGRRGDAVNNFLDQTATSGTNDLKAEGGFSVTNKTAIKLAIGITPASGKRVILKRCMGNINYASDTLRVYGKLRKYEGATDGVTRNDDTLVWKSGVTTDDTDMYIPENSVTAPVREWLQFGKDEHVVISNAWSTVAGTYEQQSTNNLKCEWMER